MTARPNAWMVVAIITLLAVSPAMADTIHVPGDQPTIQAGIGAAVNGDEVVVADGVYTGDGNRDIDFGGKLITVRSASGDPSLCILDCQGTEAEPHRGFYFHLGETADAVVQGLTIANGYATGSWPESGGGGIRCLGSSPTIAQCILAGNFAGTDGGGMYNLFGSSPTVIQCTFTGNSMGQNGYGGGICNEEDSNPVITGCTFSENQARWGGGLCNYELANGTVTDCMFVDNSAVFGGGMYNIFASSPTVTNCTFKGNTATSSGGGMRNFQGGSPMVTNCILWGDSPEEITGSAIVIYSDVQGGFPGTGNIDADPLFVDPNNGDYRLQTGSPCIDAGDNTAVPEGITTDLDGNPRFVDDTDTPDSGNGDPPIVDMGAYEFQACPWDIASPGGGPPDGTVGINDFLELLATWACVGCPADFLDPPGVGPEDFQYLLDNWGAICPEGEGSETLSLQDVIENAGLIWPDDLNTFLDCITTGSPEEHANCACWLNHYLQSPWPAIIRRRPNCQGADPFDPSPDLLHLDTPVQSGFDL